MHLPDNIIQLVEKYNRPGPRYTSYPTAPHFSEKTDTALLEKASIADAGKVSLYVHIPFCKSNCWFCGCNTIITSRNSWADQYLGLLEREIELINQCLTAKRQVSQIHLGGGTPNFLQAAQIDRLFEILRNGFEIQKNCEVSVELAPNYLDASQVEAFQRAGLTRASFGIQDINPAVQKAINRIQPLEKNVETMGLLREAGINSINIDLIYGLPLQSVQSYEATLEQVLELNPDRFAIFNYAHVPHMKPFQKKLEAHPMPTPDVKIQLLLTIINTLEKAGYNYIGMDHFAKPNDELHIAQKEHRLHRNFQGYTIQDEPEVIALGISSISETPTTYRQNHKDYETYETSINEGKWPISRGIELTEDDVLRRQMIRNIMCNLNLSIQTFAPNDQTKVKEWYDQSKNALSAFEQDGLITIKNNGFDVTDTGRMFLRNIAMEYDAYLGKGNAKFSKTV